MMNKYHITCFLPVTILTTFIYSQNPSNEYVIWALIMILFILSTVPFMYEFYTGEIDPFAPIMWTAPLFAVAYGYAAAERLWYNDFTFRASYTVQDPEQAMATVLIFASISLIAVFYGYYRTWGRQIAVALPRFKTGWDSRRAWFVITILMILGLYGFSQLFPYLGEGPRSHLVKGNTRFAFILVNFLNIASVLIASDIIIKSISYSDRKITIVNCSRIIIGGIIILTNVRILWMLGGRARAFNIFIILTFLVHYLFRRFSLAEGIAIMVGIQFLPAWLANIFSSIITIDIERLQSSLTSPVIYNDSPTRPFNNVVVLFDGVPRKQEFTYGETFASAFFEVLPFHPFREANEVYNSAFYPSIMGDFGVPITLMGELYLNFWVPGLILGMVLMGVIMRCTYEWTILQQSSFTSVVIFAVVSNSFLFMGNFSNSLPNMGLLLLPSFLSLFFICGGVIEN